ncbi:MAG: AAA family ATPase [Candidatus Bathyarchaeia archaeon]
MRIAVAGKGGVGKTFIAASLSRIYSRRGVHVIAVDADPAMNLGHALGIPRAKLHNARPISENEELIQERVKGGFGEYPVINLNPKVEDLVDSLSISGPEGIRLLVMGTVKAGGEGCLCPANTLLKSLLRYVLRSYEYVIMDTEAGLEHMGRGVAEGFDHLLVVVEPSIQSMQTAMRIRQLAKDIGIGVVSYVANKVSSEIEKTFILGWSKEKGISISSIIPFDNKVREAEMSDTAFVDYAPDSPAINIIKGIAASISG